MLNWFYSGYRNISKIYQTLTGDIRIFQFPCYRYNISAATYITRWSKPNSKPILSMLHLTMILPSTEPLCNFFQQNHTANNIHTVIQPPPTSEKARQLLQYPSKRTRRTFYVIPPPSPHRPLFWIFWASLSRTVTWAFTWKSGKSNLATPSWRGGQHNFEDDR